MKKFSGAKLVQARKDAGETQWSLALVLDVRENTVRNWEAERRTPSVDVLPQIADALKVSIDSLFSDE